MKESKTRRRFAAVLCTAFLLGGVLVPVEAFAETSVGISVQLSAGTYGRSPMAAPRPMGRAPIGPRQLGMAPIGPLRAGVGGPAGPINNYNYGPHGPQGGMVGGGFQGGGQPCARPCAQGVGQQRCAPRRVRCGQRRSAGCGGGFSLQISFGRSGRGGRRC